MAHIIYMSKGKTVKTKTIGGSAEDVCKDIKRTLKDAGHFTESGFDPKENNFWIIKNCGDNCIKIRD